TAGAKAARHFKFISGTTEVLPFPQRPSSSPPDLVLVVSVDIEPDNDTDFDRLGSTQNGTELPTVKCGENFAGHNCRGRFEHAWSSQQSSTVEHTFNHQTRLGQSRRQVRTHGLRCCEIFRVAMRCGRGI